MKTLVAAAACVLTLGSFSLHSLDLSLGFVAQPDPLKSIVESYLHIQSQLAADKTDGVKDAATTIATVASSMGESGAAMAKAAKDVSAATDLKTIRETFGPLSDSVIAAAEAHGWKGLGVKQAFCPMVQKSWLQKDEKIRNPYYGTAMLECGEIKK